MGELWPLGFYYLAHLVGDDLDHGRVEQSRVQPLQVGGQIMTLPTIRGS